jgi:threonylcarbamoyladenosine tRNA methylthiotransferase MtaB
MAVKFLGCKVSQADAILARHALLAAGHTEVAEDEADLHVVNTCCITSEAEAKGRQSVRRSLRRGARRARSTSRAVRSTSLPRTRGFVKVQDGCDCHCHCAYCIIPTVRGPARSRAAPAILAEVKRRVADGQPEMVVTGISVGDYRDPGEGLDLGDLLIEVARVPGVERVRLSSVEVIHVRDSLLRALCEEPKVARRLRALSEVRSRLHRSAKLGDELEVLVDKVAADRCSRYTADYTRCYLDQDPANPAARGELVRVRAQELHAH